MCSDGRLAALQEWLSDGAQGVKGGTFTYKLESLRLEYEYEFVHECVFRISNQLCFRSCCFSLLLISTGEEGFRNNVCVTE